MTALRVLEKAADIDSLQLSLIEQEIPQLSDGQCIVHVHSAAVNPSDVKATLGAMPHAVWPRTPGRDYAGIVIKGPPALIGKEVWGSSGELGIQRDGSHARYLSISAKSIREKPRSISMAEASGVGVPFVTAYEGFNRAGMPKKDDVVLILGASGKVAQAAIQIATRAKARVFVVGRDAREPYFGHSSGPVHVIDANTEKDIAKYVRALTDDHGADIVFNTVGSPYFEEANMAMATGATQILISTIERPVPFDIFKFYRGRHTYVGVDTLAMSCEESAVTLDLLAPGFEDGSLKPFPVDDNSIYSLSNALEAYRIVLAGARERIVIRP